MCYVSGGPGLFEASCGYFFTWQPGGGQGTIARYRDDSADTDLLKHKEQWADKIVATDLGYMYVNCVS